MKSVYTKTAIFEIEDTCCTDQFILIKHCFQISAKPQKDSITKDV